MVRRNEWGTMDGEIERRIRGFIENEGEPGEKEKNDKRKQKYQEETKIKCAEKEKSG